MDWEGVYQIFHLWKEGEIWRLPGPHQTPSIEYGQNTTDGITTECLKGEISNDADHTTVHKMLETVYATDTHKIERILSHFIILRNRKEYKR